MIKEASHLLSILVVLLCSYGVYVQNWIASYDAAFTQYSAEDYTGVFAEGEVAIAKAESAKEKLYTLKLLSVICYELEKYKEELSSAKKQCNCVKVKLYQMRSS
jgi:hypothetical protein